MIDERLAVEQLEEESGSQRSGANSKTPRALVTPISLGNATGHHENLTTPRTPRIPAGNSVDVFGAGALSVKTYHSGSQPDETSAPRLDLTALDRHLVASKFDRLVQMHVLSDDDESDYHIPFYSARTTKNPLPVNAPFFPKSGKTSRNSSTTFKNNQSHDRMPKPTTRNGDQSLPKVPKKTSKPNKSKPRASLL